MEYANTASAATADPDEPDHETARLAADTALFARDPAGQLLVALVQRKYEPRAGYWCLPGGHLNTGETDHDAAQRECAEEIGVRPEALRYVGSYRSPFRDERARVASWTWTEFRAEPDELFPDDDADDARWWPVVDVLADEAMFAFADHVQMIRDSLAVHGLTADGGTDLSADSDHVRELYRERAHLLAVLAELYLARIAYNDPNEPGMPVLYLHTNSGQVAYHLNPDDLDLFEHVLVDHDGTSTFTAWDGHTKTDALKRLTREITEIRGGEA